MIDLQLPHPLLEPKRWPEGEAVMSIFSFKYGGAFNTRRGHVFTTPADFWSREALDEPSLVAILRSTQLSNFEIVSTAALSPIEQKQWHTLGATSFRVDPLLPQPSLSDWSRAVFPQAFHEAGEVSWLRETREYEIQMGTGGKTPSLDTLRFWPAFLRKRKQAFASTAAREWAFAEALFSPQEDSRGEGPITLMNPTLQVVTEDTAMRALWRVDGAMQTRELDWSWAAVVDDLRECPRVARAVLLHALASRKFSLGAGVSFESVVSQMIDEGLILLRT